MAKAAKEPYWSIRSDEKPENYEYYLSKHAQNSASATFLIHGVDEFHEVENPFYKQDITEVWVK